MAYGRVNIFSKGGVENIKTTDVGGGTDYKLIDYKRERKIDSNNHIIYDFKNNIIAKFEGSLHRAHVGYVETNAKNIYNLKTGEKVSPPTEFTFSNDFILNEDMDYIKTRYNEIRDKQGNILYKNVNFQDVLYIQNDVVYFTPHHSPKICCYKNRKYIVIVHPPFRNDESNALRYINFL